nr:hypothetical protein GCM10020093_080800 [Planobispora longispora]
MPTALRAFLLTSAVVDDLGAITIIAVFFTEHVDVLALAAGAAVIGLYGLLQARRVRGAWIYVPLALIAWYLVEISGVHPTVAGVALGLVTRVHSAPGEENSPPNWPTTACGPSPRASPSRRSPSCRPGWCSTPVPWAGWPATGSSSA